MHFDIPTLAGYAGLFGIGAVLKSIVDKYLNRGRDRFDLARISVEITAKVMAEMRTELDDTREQLTETRAALHAANDEIAELRAALAGALAELAQYRKASQ